MAEPYTLWGRLLFHRMIHCIYHLGEIVPTSQISSPPQYSLAARSHGQGLDSKPRCKLKMRANLVAGIQTGVQSTEQDPGIQTSHCAEHRAAHHGMGKRQRQGECYIWIAIWFKELSPPTWDLHSGLLPLGVKLGTFLVCGTWPGCMETSAVPLSAHEDSNFSPTCLSSFPCPRPVPVYYSTTVSCKIQRTIWQQMHSLL